jgi:hypothetical protein
LEENIMNTTIEVTKKVTTLINILTVEPENQQKLIDADVLSLGPLSRIS